MPIVVADSSLLAGRDSAAGLAGMLLLQVPLRTRTLDRLGLLHGLSNSDARLNPAQPGLGGSLAPVAQRRCGFARGGRLADTRLRSHARVQFWLGRGPRFSSSVRNRSAAGSKAHSASSEFRIARARTAPSRARRLLRGPASGMGNAPPRGRNAPPGTNSPGIKHVCRIPGNSLK